MTRRSLPPRDQDRGTSITLSYVFTLAIATVLVSGLFIAGGNFVDDRRTQVVRQELRVIGHQVASNLAKADRLVEAGAGDVTVAVTQNFPPKVTGSTYNIELQSGGEPTLVLTSTRPEVTVEIPVRTATPVGESTVDGGVVTVTYDETAAELVITDA